MHDGVITAVEAVVETVEAATTTTKACSCFDWGGGCGTQPTIISTFLSVVTAYIAPENIAWVRQSPDTFH